MRRTKRGEGLLELNDHVKDLEFTDPTCNAINGYVYMARSGNVSYSVTCLPDQEAENPIQGSIVSGLDGVYQNVLTFVFDDGLGNRCNGTDDCPTRCCIEGVCSQKKICQDMECGECEEKDDEDICVPKPKGTICTGATHNFYK